MINTGSTGRKRESARLSDVLYTMHWFSPRSGDYTIVADSIRPEDGILALPEKPDGRDWILLIRAKADPSVGDGGDACNDLADSIKGEVAG
jgi:hypothetical protein